MPNRKNKVIIDTNLWISFLLTNDYSGSTKYFQINSSRFFLARLHSMNLLRFLSHRNSDFTLTGLQNVLIQIRKRAEFIDVATDIKVRRDPKDNFLLSLAKNASLPPQTNIC